MFRFRNLNRIRVYLYKYGLTQFIRKGISRIYGKIQKAIFTPFLERLYLLRNKIIIIRGKPIIRKIYDIPIKLAAENQVAFDLWRYRVEERNEIKFILHIVDENMIFFDVGANVGLYSILVSKKTKGKCQVFVFEPCKRTFDILCKNIKFNNLTNVFPYNIGLANYDGVGLLSVNITLRDGLNTLAFNPSHDCCRIVGKEEVIVNKLDTFIKENRISRVDIIKMDIEGAELLALYGMKELLIRDDAPLLFFECYSWVTRGFNYHPVRILWFLHDYGYQFFVIDKKLKIIRKRVKQDGYDNMFIAIKPPNQLFPKFKKGFRL